VKQKGNSAVMLKPPRHAPLRVTTRRTIFPFMSGRSTLRIILLTCAYTFTLAPQIQAQSPEAYPARCKSPFYATDEFKELIGLKVYPRIVIDEVEFDGASHLPGVSRDQLIALLEDREFDDEPNWVAGPEEHVREFWLDRGYFKVRVTSSEKILTPDPTRRHAAAAFHVEEGPQYSLKDIHFQSSDPAISLAFPPDQLRKLFPIQDGDILRTSGIRDGMEALKELYESKGYIDFTSEPVTDIDNASNQISLIFQLDQELQFRIGKIDFLGNRPQAESIVRSQMKVGDIFSERAVESFYEGNKSLLPAGASSRDLIASRSQETGTVNLTFDFRDCPN
jgi:Surface antigen variable number repeat